MLLANRKARIEYIKSIREELKQSEISQKMIVEDNFMLFEFYCVANYQKKSNYNNLLKLLKQLKLTKSSIKQLTSDADKLLTQKWSKPSKRKAKQI